jgi:hypothetical protein
MLNHSVGFYTAETLAQYSDLSNAALHTNLRILNLVHSPHFRRMQHHRPSIPSHPTNPLPIHILILPQRHPLPLTRLRIRSSHHPTISLLKGRRYGPLILSIPLRCDVHTTYSRTLRLRREQPREKASLFPSDRGRGVDAEGGCSSKTGLVGGL